MPTATKKLPRPVAEARRHLRRAGWTQTDAAERFCVTRVHLSLVLNGHRQSGRLLAAILALPERDAA